jgi:N-succinyldiaminopimelate aminotransferase
MAESQERRAAEGRAQGSESAHSAQSALRRVPRTGVIYVMNEARKVGYDHTDPEWVNLGQGQPEVGPLPGAPARVSLLESPLVEYAPVAGIWELRDAVAQHYNRLYRRGMPSQYSAENVCISPGGRAALTRVAASLGEINLGHFLPDYTAYEELLGLFRFFTPIPILLDPARGYDFSSREFEHEILGRGLSGVLASNPCNPTGKLIAQDELASWVGIARRLQCALILDEFYSHYIWREGVQSVSAAACVEDVDADPVLIIDGLTKNWRYPGWRVAWTVGPKDMIDALSSAGSFLDGGGSRPAQLAAVPLLEASHIDAESAALKRAFGPKRSLALQRLSAMGVHVDSAPEGTFYVWGDLRYLPEPINTGMSFFREALKSKVICVPGEFFDINPGHRRADRPSRFRRHVRFSFGPDLDSLRAGLDRLAALVEGAKA